MPDNILVPLDGSVLAEQALPVAQRIARAQKARLLIVRVLESADREPDTTSREVWAQNYLAKDYVRHTAEMAFRDSGVEAKATIVCGDTLYGIQEAVRQHQPSLIVMATHGRSGLGRWLFGSTTDAVIRNVDVPVMVLPSSCRTLGPESGHRPLRILLALDGSDRSQLLLEPVRQLAIALGAEIVLARLVDEPPGSTVRLVGGAPVIHYGMDQQLTVARDDLESVAQQLRSSVRDVSVRCEPGDARHRIAQIADEEGADLIALVTRGRGGLTRFFLGSVATATLRRSRVPLLLLRARVAGQMPMEVAATAPDQQAVAPSAEPSGTPFELTRSDVGLILEGLNALQLTERTTASETRAAGELQQRLRDISRPRVDAATPA
jgi:nucleotide-binding universal stress UspA family protein